MPLKKLLTGITLMLMAACGTITPTLTPSATTVNDSDSDSVVPLRYTSVNGSQTVNYPRGWVVEEQASLIALANNDATMRLVVAQGALESGQAGLIIVPFSAETVALMSAGGDDPTTVAGFVTNLASNIATGTPSEATEITLNDKNAAYITLLLDTGDSIAIVVEVEGGAYVLLQGATASGELEQFQDTFLAIAGTLTFTPASSAETTPEAAATATP
jgi:hypothetical protein